VSRFRFVEDHQRAVGVKRLCQVLRGVPVGVLPLPVSRPAVPRGRRPKTGWSNGSARSTPNPAARKGAPRVHAGSRAVGEPVNRKRCARPSATASVRHDDTPGPRVPCRRARGGSTVHTGCPAAVTDVCDRPVTVLRRSYDIGAALSRVCPTRKLRQHRDWLTQAGPGRCCCRIRVLPRFPSVTAESR
jgi:hypothetical protein